MKQTFGIVIYWAWIVFATLDVIAGLLGWLELRGHADATTNRLSKVLYAGGQRSFATIVGLLLFGVNLRASLWYLMLGLWALVYKAYATWGWLFYYRGMINGGGFWDLFRRKRKILM